MKRLYKTITLSSLSALAVVAPVVTVVACGGSSSSSTIGGNYSTNWKVGSPRDIKVLMGTASGTNPYGAVDWQFIPKVTSAATMEEGLTSSTVGPFRMDVEGFSKYDSQGNLIDGFQATTKEVLRFEAAKSVTIVAGTETFVFDSDSSDENDTKSINGTKFLETIQRDDVKSISIDFPEEANRAKWITQGSGTATTATVGPEDMWYTISNGIYSNDKTRDDALGSENRSTADNWSKQSAQHSYTGFSAPEASQPESPWLGSLEVMYGLDCSPYITDNMSNAVKGNSFVFNFNETDGIKTSNFWEYTFRKQGGLKLLSSAQIKDIATRISVPGVPTSSPVNKYGVYQYMSLPWNQYQTAGQYYLRKVENKEVVYVQNPNYIDQEWLALTDTITSYTYSFASQTEAPANAVAGFKQGLYSMAGLDPKQVAEAYREATQNPEQFGVFYTRGYTANGSLGDSSYTFLNANPFSTKPDFNYYFNDGYSLVMFGGTIADFTTPTPTDKQIEIRKHAYEHFYSGIGLQFRSAINAALNYVTAATEYNRGYQDWQSRFAPELIVNGSDGEVQPINVDDLSSKEMYDFNETTHALTQVGEVTEEEYKAQYARVEGTAAFLAGDNVVANGGADLTTAKRLVKESLDAMGIGTSGHPQKIQFEIPIGRGITFASIIPIYEQMRQAINSLDPRLEVSAELNPVTASASYATGSTTDTDGHQFTTASTSLGVKTSAYTEGFKLVKPDGQTSNHVSRIASAGAGAGAFSTAPTVNPYEVPSPSSAMLSNIGYLQDGLLFALSLAAQDNSPYKGTTLEPLKAVADVMSQTLEEFKTTKWTTVEAVFGQNVSSVADELLQGMQTINFKDIINTDMSLVGVYDYAAFPSFSGYITAFETLQALDTSTKAAVIADPTAKAIFDRYMAAPSGSDEETQAWTELSANTIGSAYVSAHTDFGMAKREYSRMESLVNMWFQKSVYELRDAMEHMSVEENVAIMNAWDEVSPFNLNIEEATIGNRHAPAPSLRKSWLLMNVDHDKYTFMGSWRIDFDIINNI